MKKFYLIVSALFFLMSCQQETGVQGNVTAGEWVPTGTKYALGSDTDVDIVKQMHKAVNAMDSEKMQTLMADTIRFYSHNSKEPIVLANEDINLWLGQFDSIQTKALYYIPYNRNDYDSKIVQSTQDETLYYKDGKMESSRILNKFFIKDNKIHTIRQFKADW